MTAFGITSLLHLYFTVLNFSLNSSSIPLLALCHEIRLIVLLRKRNSENESAACVSRYLVPRHVIPTSFLLEHLVINSFLEFHVSPKARMFHMLRGLANNMCLRAERPKTKFSAQRKPIYSVK